MDALEELCAAHGVTLDQLNEFAALDIEEAWAEQAAQDGDVEPNTWGISGSDIGGYLADIGDAGVEDLILRRKPTASPR